MQKRRLGSLAGFQGVYNDPERATMPLYVRRLLEE